MESAPSSLYVKEGESSVETLASTRVNRAETLGRLVGEEGLMS